VQHRLVERLEVLAAFDRGLHDLSGDRLHAANIFVSPTDKERDRLTDDLLQTCCDRVLATTHARSHMRDVLGVLVNLLNCLVVRLQIANNVTLDRDHVDLEISLDRVLVTGVFLSLYRCHLGSLLGSLVLVSILVLVLSSHFERFVLLGLLF